MGASAERKLLFFLIPAAASSIFSLYLPHLEFSVDEMSAALSPKWCVYACVCVGVYSKSNPPSWGLMPAKRGLYLY